MSIRIGEVIEASTTEFVAQAYALHDAPPFGALVRAGDGGVAVYGLTYDASTTSLEPGRRPIARGQHVADEEEIYRQNPQLPRLLRTDFRALVVGHSTDDTMHHYLPPRPPRVHGFVHLCSAEEVTRFTESFDFLSLVATAHVSAPVDELLAACLREATRARGGDRAYLVSAGKELARLLGGESQRLNAVLRRMRP